MAGPIGRKSSLAEINVTPLVDVMLVLLIIFMVTAPMLHHGMKVSPPDAPDGDTKIVKKGEDEKLTLVFSKDRKIKLGGKEVKKDNLLTLLRNNRELQKTKELYFDAHPDCDYGAVAELLGITRRAGIDKIGFVVDPEKLK